MGKAERTRQYILEKSAQLFNVKGVAGTTVQDIQEVTKLGKGGLYGNFESKEDIALAAFDHLRGRLQVYLDEAVDTQETAKGKLFALLDAYAKIYKESKGGCPLLNFGVESDDTEPVMKDRVRQAARCSQQRIYKLVVAGIASGEFTREMDARIFALKAFATVEGGIFLSRLHDSPRQMNQLMELLKHEIESYCL
ncbi:MAG TPA: TetR/AcrR family transcriptional regulator [Ohtaekwangia sp.]|uniref:TetR/AcrR family transcriptional regulator n=1 Tax=Ohtaekwangia sp. TaxID=2066019 RepID=UPI002F93BA35